MIRRRSRKSLRGSRFALDRPSLSLVPACGPNGSPIQALIGHRLCNRHEIVNEIKRAVGGLGIIGAMVLNTAIAGAQEIAAPSVAFRHDTPWEAQRFSLLAHVGLDSPIGVTGVTLDYAPNRWFVLAGGAGTNARSYELEGAVKGRLVLDDFLATGAGLGLAYGQPRTWCYHAFDPPTCDPPGAVPSAFLEVYVDARSVNGVIARLYAGALSPLRGEVQSTFLALRTTWVAPYLGAAFGQSF